MKATLKKLLRTPMVLERYTEDSDAFGNVRYDIPVEDVCAVTAKNRSLGDSGTFGRDIAGRPEDGRYTLICDFLSIKPRDKVTFEGRTCVVTAVETYNDLRGVPQAEQITVEEDVNP